MNLHKEVEAHYKEHGDKILFKKLEHATYDMQRGNLTKYCYGRLKDWMLAEDAVHDTYLHMLEYPPKGEGHNFGGLFKLTLDRKISLIKKVEMKKGAVIDEKEDEDDESLIDRIESDELTPERILSIAALTELVMDLSGRLPPKQKAIVRLSLIFNYSYAEIIHFANTDFKVINNVIHRFRNKVKRHHRYEDICI